MKITIRQATRDDARFIAGVVAMAIGHDGSKDYVGDDVINALTEVALRDDSQYSYRNALIAEADGKIAGAIVGYDGADLESLREASLSVIRKYHPDIVVTDDETGPDEFYIDSLGVLPEYRGKGIARRLIDALIDRASEKGHRRFGLLVDFENHSAEALYRSIGFTQVGITPFFGHPMKHLQLINSVN
ncbi:MAG: GNAT family N-acetyltransferase [Lachnoclostridium sp.]|nr:GNAT family N-acetyltransferase [Lachnoclostridium sp.]